VHNATGGILSREKCMQVSEHVGNGTLVPLDDDAFQKQIVLLRQLRDERVAKEKQLREEEAEAAKLAAADIEAGEQ